MCDARQLVVNERQEPVERLLPPVGYLTQEPRDLARLVTPIGFGHSPSRSKTSELSTGPDRGQTEPDGGQGGGKVISTTSPKPQPVGSGSSTGAPP